MSTVKQLRLEEEPYQQKVQSAKGCFSEQKLVVVKSEKNNLRFWFQRPCWQMSMYSTNVSVRDRWGVALVWFLTLFVLVVILQRLVIQVGPMTNDEKQVAISLVGKSRGLVSACLLQSKHLLVSQVNTHIENPASATNKCQHFTRQQVKYCSCVPPSKAWRVQRAKQEWTQRLREVKWVTQV